MTSPVDIPDLIPPHVRLAWWYLTTPWLVDDDERVTEAVHALRCAGECGS